MFLLFPAYVESVPILLGCMFEFVGVCSVALFGEISIPKILQISAEMMFSFDMVLVTWPPLFLS